MRQPALSALSFINYLHLAQGQTGALRPFTRIISSLVKAEDKTIKWDSVVDESSYFVFIHKVIGNSLHFLQTSQKSYKVSNIGSHFSEDELKYEVIFPERNLEGQS